MSQYKDQINLFILQTISVDEPVEEEPKTEETKTEDEDGKVEEVKDEAPKTKKVEKTTWDWERVNNMKPIWMRKSGEVDENEYNEFYKSITKDNDQPIAHVNVFEHCTQTLLQVHFMAEGEVTFKSILFVPKRSPMDLFQNYGKTTENIKVNSIIWIHHDDYFSCMWDVYSSRMTSKIWCRNIYRLFGESSTAMIYRWMFLVKLCNNTNY